MLLDEKYISISPSVEYLSDPVVLLNAWKKSQQYIRYNNWYVECLDLDRSALELDSRVKYLSEGIKNKKLELKNLF